MAIKKVVTRIAHSLTSNVFPVRDHLDEFYCDSLYESKCHGAALRLKESAWRNPLFLSHHDVYAISLDRLEYNISGFNETNELPSVSVYPHQSHQVKSRYWFGNQSDVLPFFSDLQMRKIFHRIFLYMCLHNARESPTLLIESFSRAQR